MAWLWFLERVLSLDLNCVMVGWSLETFTNGTGGTSRMDCLMAWPMLKSNLGSYSSSDSSVCIRSSLSASCKECNFLAFYLETNHNLS